MDTIDRLISALVQRDTRQFPGTFEVEQRIEYAKDYVIGMLKEALRGDVDLDEYFERRAEIVEGDVETATAWKLR